MLSTESIKTYKTLIKKYINSIKKSNIKQTTESQQIMKEIVNYEYKFSGEDRIKLFDVFCKELKF